MSKLLQCVASVREAIAILDHFHSFLPFCLQYSQTTTVAGGRGLGNYCMCCSSAGVGLHKLCCIWTRGPACRENHSPANKETPRGFHSCLLLLLKQSQWWWCSENSTTIKGLTILIRCWLIACVRVISHTQATNYCNIDNSFTFISTPFSQRTHNDKVAVFMLDRSGRLAYYTSVCSDWWREKVIRFFSGRPKSILYKEAWWIWNLYSEWVLISLSQKTFESPCRFTINMYFKTYNSSIMNLALRRMHVKISTPWIHGSNKKA